MCPGEQEVEDVLLVLREIAPPHHLGLVERDCPNANGDPRPVLDELEIVGNLHAERNLQAASHPEAEGKLLRE